jgi:hypothetical protein
MKKYHPDFGKATASQVQNFADQCCDEDGLQVKNMKRNELIGFISGIENFRDYRN